MNVDVDRIRAIAKARTRGEWLAKPARAVLWHLMRPYVEAVLATTKEFATDDALRPPGALTLKPGDRVKLLGRDLTLVATDHKSQFLVLAHDLIGDLVASGREWEPHVRAAIALAADPQGVAVDVGAYIGLHTVLMSRLFRTVHAFEPQRAIYDVLRANLALNGCDNVEAANFGLYDRPGTMRLAGADKQEIPVRIVDGQPVYGDLLNAAALTFELCDDAATAGGVAARTLDELRLENVRLIKIDTQGADLRVLRGAVETLRRCRPTVLFEWEKELGEQHGTSLADFHAFFAQAGYAVSLLKEVTPGRQADFCARPA
ncbi:FkbM family methyltransferase [Rhodoplanes roseus]|nr:FkbM family methyltransferase [Rhodoplanes roseus]